MSGVVDYRAIGKRIRALRKQKKWTQSKLAQQCGCSISFLGHIERNTRIPSLETVVKIAALLDVSIHELVYGFDTSPTRSPATMQKAFMLNDIAHVLIKYINDWL